MDQRPTELVAEAQALLAQGRAADFVALLSQDVKLVVRGTTRISGTFEGAEAILGWFAAIGPRIVSATVEPGLVLADGDWVVTSDHIEATTVSGALYRNDYLRMWRCTGGRIVEIVEYLDTEAVTNALLAD